MEDGCRELENDVGLWALSLRVDGSGVGIVCSFLGSVTGLRPNEPWTDP